MAKICLSSIPVSAKLFNLFYNAVLISLSDWHSIQETLFLEQVGVMDKVRERENDGTGFSAVSELDWDSL